MRWIQTGGTICFKTHTLEEALRGLSEAGFKHVEIHAVKGWLEHLDPDQISPETVRQAQALLERYELDCVSLSGHSQLHTDEGKTRLSRVLQAGKELGAQVVNTFTGDAATPEERAAFINNARAIADEAEAAGIRLCIETDSNLMPTAAAGKEILAEISHPWIRINYDTGNVIYYAGADPVEDIEYALPLLGHVHLKDKRGGRMVFDFPPLGEGEIQIPAILRRLDQTGFAGPVSMEIEFDGTWPDWNACLDATKRGKTYWDTLLTA